MRSEGDTSAASTTPAHGGGAGAGAQGPIVGIDLGTTNSLVAVVKDGAPIVLAHPGEREASGARALLLPSVVRYALGGSTGGESGGAAIEAIGWAARDAAHLHPSRTVSSVKRLMGRSARDAAADAPYLSYRIEPGPNDTARIAIPGMGSDDSGARLVSPQEVSAAILRALRERASAALGVAVRRAVITVPAYFDDAQRQATRDAARLAGLDAVRVVNEPTAAALAYGVGIHLKKPTIIAVYDLGGGTFDVSILRVTPSNEPGARASGQGCATPSLALGARTDAASGPLLDPAFFEVLATAGDTHLGGDDVDQMLLAMFLREIREGAGGAGGEDGAFAGAPPDAATVQALRAFAEATKVRLSGSERASVRVEVGGAGAGGAPFVYERTIERAEFEGMIRAWAERTIARCRQALRDARLSAADIETVVLVGGSTRIPLIRAMVGEFFGREPYTALDPDLVVAMGAAVQASLLDGSMRGALLLDVLPLSLGIETAGGGVAKLIMRNSNVPARATEMFSTSVDGQTSIRLHVLQGEREMAGDCRSLGLFHLAGIPPMPAGMPQVEVEFLVDESGVLRVSAHERRSGKRAALQVIPNHGLTRDEVERIETESFAHAREDMTRHRIADLVVNARLDVKWVRGALARVRGALPGEYVRDLEASLAALEALAARADNDWASVNGDEFHRAKEGLDRLSVPLHEAAITASLREG